MAELIEMPFGFEDWGVPMDPCIKWGPDPHGRGNFEGGRCSPL